MRHIDYLVQIAEDVGEMKGAVRALDEKLDEHGVDRLRDHADHEARLRSVETGRARMLGALAVVAPLAGMGGAYLMKTFGGN